MVLFVCHGGIHDFSCLLLPLWLLLDKLRPRHQRRPPDVAGYGYHVTANWLLHDSLVGTYCHLGGSAGAEGNIDKLRAVKVQANGIGPNTFRDSIDTFNWDNLMKEFKDL
jgi:hypothetical protein